ncbi:response regulator, partial [Bradyrhizobium sp. CCBAU 11445]
MTGRFNSPGEGSNAEASTKATVFVVEDDISMRRSLTNLFQSVGLGVIAFGSAREMLQSPIPDVISCLVLDVRLPGLSGLD